MGLCPICLGVDADGLTTGLAAAALVLLGTTGVIMVSFARLAYRLWMHEKS